MRNFFSIEQIRHRQQVFFVEIVVISIWYINHEALVALGLSPFGKFAFFVQRSTKKTTIGDKTMAISTFNIDKLQNWLDFLLLSIKNKFLIGFSWINFVLYFSPTTSMFSFLTIYLPSWFTWKISTNKRSKSSFSSIFIGLTIYIIIEIFDYILLSLYKKILFSLGQNKTMIIPL